MLDSTRALATDRPQFDYNDFMSGSPELLNIVRAARRRLAEVGHTRSRSEGDFERVALPDQDADVLRDLLVGHA